jgi:hypothetical protein
MADTTTLITVEEAVTRFMLKNKKQTEDYTSYLEHACDCLRQFRTYDSKEARSEKVSVSSLGIIEMPDDMLGFKDVCVAKNGEWWSFTERAEMVNTTTFTGLVEGHDSDFGEGVALNDGTYTTYGSKGAINEYYYAIDWNQRRIFCDGIISDTVLLKYISSGISTTDTTYIPELFIETMDAYLLWKESFWIKDLVRERESRRQDYINARLQLRGFLNALTASQWKDLLWGTFTQTPKR